MRKFWFKRFFINNDDFIDGLFLFDEGFFYFLGYVIFRRGG